MIFNFFYLVIYLFVYFVKVLLESQKPGVCLFEKQVLYTGFIVVVFSPRNIASRFASHVLCLGFICICWEFFFFSNDGSVDGRIIE